MEPMDPMAGYGGGYGTPKSSLIERLKGVVMFKSPIYHEIAKDTEATGSAVMVLVVSSIIAGIISGLQLPFQLQMQLQDPQTQQALRELNIDPAFFFGAGALVMALVLAILNPILSLIGWAIFSWLNAFVANRFFKGNTSTGEIMRVSGYAYIFAPLSAIMCIGVIGWLLSIFANVIGIREAAEIDTGNAILTWLVSVVIIVAVVIGLYCCLVFGMFAIIAGLSSNQ